VAMLEQMRELERAAGVESAAPAPAIEEDSEPDYGAIDASLTETEDVAPAAPVVEEPEPAPAESEGEEDPDIIQGRTRPVFETEEAEDEAQFADIPGFQKERDVIIEPSSSDGGAHDDASGDADPEVAIEVDRDEDDWRVKSAADEIQAAPRGASDSSPDDNDGFIIGPRGKKKAEKAPASEPEKGERKAAPKKSRVAPIPVEEVSGIVDDASEAVEPVDVIEEDSDPDAVDLYEYGAVDYVAGVHA